MENIFCRHLYYTDAHNICISKSPPQQIWTISTRNSTIVRTESHPASLADTPEFWNSSKIRYLQTIFSYWLPFFICKHNFNKSLYQILIYEIMQERYTRKAGFSTYFSCNFIPTEILGHIEQFECKNYIVEDLLKYTFLVF